MPPHTPASPMWKRPLEPGPALAWTAATMITFLAASSAPSPLYALYREAWGFSALTLTWVFGSYAFALLAALLVCGRLSDHLGRRPVIVAALVLEFASVVLFWQAESVAWLLAARILQGVATGIATSALSSMLLDLNPLRASMLNGVSPMVGMALGALGTAALVQFAPAPTRLVYEVLLVLLAVQFLMALRLPDTQARRPGAWASLRPQLAVPLAARATLRRLLLANTVGWALMGFFLSLGPTLARQVTGNDAPLTGGALIAAMTLPGALSSVLAQRRMPAQALVFGTAGLTLGLVFALAGIWWRVPAGLFAGALTAGFSMGCSFNGTLRTLVPLAPPQQRAGLMASFFVCSYLAFSVPAIGAGLATGWYGLYATALGYGVALLALVSVALLATLRQRELPA
ncbi:MFS transporter [Pseudorhodoferax sp. Leaf267]|uniref:MFS transporter n=1 Tax=Pseudorhodoferax sp. Leaf267 TaxID=1736316 RepID=UPI0006F77E3E|nr:MFS transporter [Pseudorhodoferax sp. Leaf267]KQP17758.1 MFS transporter [Pseudorhodoferax sp. Leaf267]